MNRYLQKVWSTETAGLHPIDDATALGDNPQFACPLPIDPEIRKQLVVLLIEHISFDEVTHLGKIVVSEAIAPRTKRGFGYMHQYRIPIASMTPIAAHGWDDMRSMMANNTSGFNYRYKTGSTTELSLHAYGYAFDINPWQNPCRLQRGIWIPEGARYDPEAPGTITKDGLAARIWRDLGFVCGVDWQDPFDPQHIQFPLAV